ncbi:hypothetical protein H633G_11450 [Metarhizium anisopliae BRIP 53284]|nr:hypothetical protein H633G_11450 [Metarhizium anisopliae BRIP 53284]
MVTLEGMSQNLGWLKSFFGMRRFPYSYRILLKNAITKPFSDGYACRHIVNHPCRHHLLLQKATKRSRNTLQQAQSLHLIAQTVVKAIHAMAANVTRTRPWIAWQKLHSSRHRMLFLGGNNEIWYSKGTQT